MADDLDIRLKADYCDNAKITQLVARLGEGAVRCHLRLLMFTARRYPKGVLEGLDETWIAAHAGWTGDAEYFVGALVDCLLLDRTSAGYAIHHWEDHQGWMFYAPERKKKAQNAARKRWGQLPEPNLFTAVHRSTPSDTAAPLDTVSKPLDTAVKNAPSNAPNPTPNPTPTPLPPATTVLQKQPTTAVRDGPEDPEWIAMRRILAGLAWKECEINFLLNWCKRRLGDPPNTCDPSFIWPLAHAIYATRKQKRIRPAYVMESKGEPADEDLEDAKRRLAAELARDVTPAPAQSEIQRTVGALFAKGVNPN